MKVSKFLSILAFVALVFGVESRLLAAREILPDPFFRRYDLANEIVEATLVEVKPSGKRIQDALFEKFPDEAFMVAKIKVAKSWKGKLKPGQVAEFRFARPTGMADSHREEQIAFRYELELGKRLSYFLRWTDGAFVGSTLFGISSPAVGLQSLKAMRDKLPESEVITRMEDFDRWFYQKQMKKTGKIDRLAERPPPPPVEGVDE